MTFILRNLSSFVLPACIALGAAPAALAGDDAMPAPLEAIDWKPGQACVYDIVHADGKRRRWHFAVTEIVGDEVHGTWTREDDAKVSIASVQPDKGTRFTRGIDMIHGTPMTAEPAMPWVVFPLEPGKGWEARSQLEGTDFLGRPWRANITSKAKVAAWERIDVGGIEIPVLKVALEESIGGSNFSGRARGTGWIGAGHCATKRFEYRNSFNDKFSLDLVSESAP